MLLEKESMEKKDGEKEKEKDVDEEKEEDGDVEEEKDEEYLTDMNIVTILRSSSAGVQVSEAVLHRDV